jgi:hypothetical protein
VPGLVRVDKLARSGAVGAVVNGPNDPASSTRPGLGDYPAGTVKCPADASDPYAALSTPTTRYVDDARAWQQSLAGSRCG